MTLHIFTIIIVNIIILCYLNNNNDIWCQYQRKHSYYVDCKTTDQGRAETCIRTIVSFVIPKAYFTFAQTPRVWNTKIYIYICIYIYTYIYIFILIYYYLATPSTLWVVTAFTTHTTCRHEVRFETLML